MNKVAGIQKSLRYRVNVSVSTKGQKTWDCTVDFEQAVGFMPEDEAVKSMNDTLELSDKLVAELEKRYPPQFLIGVKE